MLRVLVAVASKHGATYEIADRIAARLRSHGLGVVVSPPADATDLVTYDAALVGSAVYAGHWRRAARRFVKDRSESLREMPVWLFSNGPVGADCGAPEDPHEIDRLIDETHARDHHMFSGRLSRDTLSIGERLVVQATGAPYGDFRNWADIDVWADAVAVELEKLVPNA